MRHTWAGGATSSRKRTSTSFHRQLAAVCISLTLAGTPVTGALADEGFTTVQFEFALGKTVKLRQVKLAFQGELSPTQGFTIERIGQSGVAIPLYSMNAQAPGLLNYLNVSGDKGKGKSGASAGTVIAVVVAVGLLGVLAYGVGKCIKETTDYDFDGSKQDDKSCSSVSSAVGGLGGLS
jgi:hypothetical protein